MSLVLVADPIAEDGLALLRPHADVQVLAGDRAGFERLLPDAEALLVRSETRVTAEVLERAAHLRVIGRAGAGVDTIDVDTATRRGVVVVNAPGGNAVAAAEHSLGLIFALARRVAVADASMKRGEWRRSAYVGTELTGKTLGLVGLGRVGAEVARRALGLDMRVLVYDPYVPDEHARRLGLEPTELEPLLRAADFVSLHVPLTENTRNLLDAARLACMRPTAFLINCARGGLVDEAALLAALDSGQLAGAGIDVYPTEPVASEDPLPRHPKVVATPHLGASTVEAQAQVAIQVATEVLAVLEGRPTQFAVNAPSLRPEDSDFVEPYIGLVQMLGKLATQLADGHIRSAEISYRGEIADRNVTVLTAAAVQGLLEPISDVPINLVNARLFAQQRGLDVTETKSTMAAHYTSLVRITVNTSSGATSVAGVISDGRANVVQIDEYELHLPPTPGYLLVTQHVDQPGIIGLVGTLLGEADINISSMQVGRRTARGEALMLLSVDEPVPPTVVDRIRHAANIETIKVIKL
ncbi:MAG: phosphoglycerate dehydrogenase [Chloroflexi bacterium]|nr:phosphoglycerate dehydrogenase [Chloroflexota bacterium]MBV9899413.1 phosphoglycerate dehydrogenase [Chloroflexota bacterium]